MQRRIQRSLTLFKARTRFGVGHLLSRSEGTLNRAIRQAATLEYLVISPNDYEEKTQFPLLIWLHGFGADMHDLADLAAASPGYLQVLPNEPLGRFGGPEGAVRAWY